jgi:hypothetical protein
MTCETDGATLVNAVSFILKSWDLTYQAQSALDKAPGFSVEQTATHFRRSAAKVSIAQSTSTSLDRNINRLAFGTGCADPAKRAGPIRNGQNH